MPDAPPPDQQAFEAWIRGGELPCVAHASGKCSGRMEFAHLQHRGMGGKEVPSIGNGVPMCSGHHTARGDSYHRAGRFTFESTHAVDLYAIAAWYKRRWSGDFFVLTETAPVGAA